ncbi:RNA ligase [Faustovirus]|nr:RNA ligase [Faustovirus]QJX73419.1 RNA ligase [Faustovirus]
MSVNANDAIYEVPPMAAITTPNLTALNPVPVNYNTIQVIMESSSQESPVDYFHKVYKYFKLGYEPCTVWNEKSDKTTGRMVISVNRKRFNTEHKFAYVLNGFIVEYVNVQTDAGNKNQLGRILAVPIPLLLTQNRQQAAMNKLTTTLAATGQFEVYPVLDGTNVVLYYYDNRWCISTVNSFEINTLKWLNDITYEQALCETLKVEKFSDFTDKLNRDYCYVLGFHHKQMHPLDSEFDSVWGFRAYDTARLTADVLQLQSTGAAIDAYAAIDINSYEVKLDIEGVKAVEPMADYDVVNLLRSNEAALSKFVKQSQIWYGFIVRGDVNKLGEYSNMLFESSLLTAMRNYLYNFPKDRELKCLSSVDKIKYQALKAYLDHRNRETFKTLFPSIANVYYPDFHHLLYEITNRILSMFRSRPAWASAAEHAHDDWFNLTSYLLAKRIAQASKIQAFSAEAIKIINDMVCSHHYTTYLLRALLREQVDESDRNFNKHKVKKPKYDKSAVRKFVKGEEQRTDRGHRNARHPTTRDGAAPNADRTDRNMRPNNTERQNRFSREKQQVDVNRERLARLRDRVNNHADSNATAEQRTNNSYSASNSYATKVRDDALRSSRGDNFSWRRQQPDTRPRTDQMPETRPNIGSRNTDRAVPEPRNNRFAQNQPPANDWNEVRRGRNKEKYNRNKFPKENM